MCSEDALELNKKPPKNWDHSTFTLMVKNSKMWINRYARNIEICA